MKLPPRVRRAASPVYRLVRAAEMRIADLHDDGCYGAGGVRIPPASLRYRVHGSRDLPSFLRDTWESADAILREVQL